MHFSLSFLKVTNLDQVVVQFLKLLILYRFFSDPFFVPGSHYSPERCGVVEEVVVKYELLALGFVCVSEHFKGCFGKLTLTFREK